MPAKNKTPKNCLPVPWSSQSKTVRQGDRQQNRRGRRGRCGSGGQWTMWFEEKNGFANKVVWVLRFYDPFPYVLYVHTYPPELPAFVVFALGS